MIFWIFVILFVLSTAITVTLFTIINKCDDKKKHTKFVDFICYNEEITAISNTIAVISGLVLIGMLIFIIPAQISAGGKRAANEQRYLALIYKAQTESIRDEFGITNKEYIDEVQAWNESLAKYQSRSHNFWIGIFYPEKKYDGLELIDYESIRM